MKLFTLAVSKQDAFEQFVYCWLDLLDSIIGICTLGFVYSGFHSMWLFRGDGK